MRILCPALVVTAASLAAQPASAMGLFEALFGRAARPQPQVYYVPSWDQDAFRPEPPRQVRVHRPKPHRSIREVAVRPLDIRKVKLSESDAKSPLGPFLDDPTLQTGDIVVTREGMKVFDGAAKAIHSAAEFRPLNKASSLISMRKKELFEIEKASRFVATATVADRR